LIARVKEVVVALVLVLVVAFRELLRSS